MTIEEALREASGRLKGVASRPRLEAEILLGDLLALKRHMLHLASNDSLEEADSYFALVERRAEGEPIEYITGMVSFYDVELEVGPGVLIARPETELLVDKAAEVIEKYKIERVAEIGVGSGAVSLVLARKFPRLRIVATDISERALIYAKRNLARYDLLDRVSLKKCDMLSDVTEDIELIVSNPPYISDGYKLPLPVTFEPKEALFGGESGDELIKKIIDSAAKSRISHIVCEMGFDQREKIASYCRQKALSKPEFYKDLAGFDRGFYLKMFND
ncbi:MAG: peptide chain release factor N(5)-glutamine methyltransferase [Hydrogenimonas sp.]|nr:peptide chain release factor N(5)-glutamine methyltransferase [Hydrogenimonas sp.]